MSSSSAQGSQPVHGTVTVDSVTGTVTVDGTVSIDPGTLATAAKQDTGNTSLATLAGTVAGAEIQADVLTLPAITGSVTANAGTNLNTSALATAALQLPDSHNVTVDNASAGSAVNIQDGGNAITIDFAGVAPPIGGGTEATALKVTIASDSTGVLSVDDNGGALTVDFAGVAPPIGGGTEATALKVTIASDSTGVLSVDDNGSSLTVDGSAVNPATAYGKTITYVAVAQGAAGTTELAAASGSNKHKIIGGMLTMSLAGTLKFNDGTVDLTGPMTFATNGGMVVPESPVPFCQTAAVNRPMNLITTLGNANGVIAILTEP